MILSIDTTRELGSLAIADATCVLEEVVMRAPEGYSAILFSEIARLIARHSLSIADFECFATAAGPGTLTGVRMGLTCAKGLAAATDKPVCAVSNLEALAEFGTKEMRAVTIDARRGDVYAAVYGPRGQVIVPECVMPPEQFRASLPPGDIEFVEWEGPLAGAIAKVALRSPWRDPADVDANYIRRSNAELNLIERRS